MPTISSAGLGSGHGQGGGQSVHRGPATYTVQSGDTLWDIAIDHHLSLGELLAANPQINNPDVIMAGQVVKLPSERLPSRLPRVNHPAAAGHAGGGSGQAAGVAKPKRNPPAPGVPNWYRIALDEERHYVSGREAIYHKQSGVGCLGQDWCSVFVNWVMQRVGYTGTRNALAASWMKWGIPLKEPRRGAIVVLDDGYMNDPKAPNNPFFHVAFVDSCSRGVLRCLGGNQSRAVTLATYMQRGGSIHKGSPQRFHFRWPPR